MKILNGTRTIRRFKVFQNDESMSFAEISEILTKFGFTDPENNDKTELTMGFVHSGDIFQNIFNEDDYNSQWSFQDDVYGSLRLDEKKLPTAVFKAKAKRKIREWLTANNREKIFKKTKDELLETVALEMYQKIRPKMKTVEFHWNKEENYLLLFTTSNKSIQIFSDYFYQAFGHSLEPVTPGMMMNQSATKDMFFKGEGDEVINDELNKKFTEWLFYKTAIQADDFEVQMKDGVIVVKSGNKILFDDGASKTAISGEYVFDNEETKTAFKQTENQIKEMEVFIETPEQTFKLALKGDYLDISGLKVMLNSIELDAEDERATMLIFRKDEYQRVYKILRELYSLFAHDYSNMEISRQQQIEKTDWE